MARPQPLFTRLARKYPRLVKFGRQYALSLTGRRQPTRPVFVIGAQRSGTRLPLHVLDASPDLITYNEGSAPYFDGVLLRDDATLRDLLARSPFPVTVLKPICESHRAQEFLATFPSSRIVWIFRDYRDTVRSAALKWKGGVRQLGALATGDLETAAWRAGGLSPARFAEVREMYAPDMSLIAAYAAMYYLRNQLFFDLGLDREPRVLLVRYEDLVQAPTVAFPRLFAFLDLPFDPSYVEGVYASSVQSADLPGLPDEITRRCVDVQHRLQVLYDASRRAQA